MRERTTWQAKVNTTPRQAATSRRADIYDMNMAKGRTQPSPVEYESGDPDTWAETPATNKNVEAEYEAGHVKRNEIGLGEFREDTFKHKDSDQWNGGGKYDNQRQAAERKAIGVERIARTLLRTNNEGLVERMALDLMSMPMPLVERTLERIRSASHESLPEEARFRRAYACTKLAARIIGEDAPEDTLERLAASVMTIDDPTLTDILTQVARYAAESDEDEKHAEGAEEDEKHAEAGGWFTKMKGKKAEGADKEEEEKHAEGAKHAEAAKEAEGTKHAEAAKEDEAPKEAEAAKHAEGAAKEDQDEQACWSSEEEKMMKAMMSEDSADESKPEAPAAPVEAPAEDVKEVDLSVDLGDEAPEAKHHASVLDALFADDPEVVAQRQLAAAARGESNFNVGRTASAGAKKLGTVRKSDKISADDLLEALWERP